ncbi:MAG: DASS family sodium-coupled anion symporter [Candidatus Eiseniibacteriota bacterium]|nr:MAG: DASS family sodium-coupled anion symporter [Candidatus Eisenbacteria bacterium]
MPPEEKITAAEERFERWRSTVGLFLGPVVGVAVLLLPMPGLTAEAHRLAGIIAWVIVWWVTEPIPIPVTALLGAVLCVLFGVASARTVFAPFADPIIYLFLGSFVLAQGMAVHGLDKRFAYQLMSIRWVGSSAGRLLFMFGAVAALISMWISNTATTAMMFPIGLGIVYTMSGMIAEKTAQHIDPHRLRYGTGMMLMAAYAASAGGIGTPVGSPPNLIGLAMMERLLDVRISFFQWMLFAIPLLVVMYVLLFALMRVLHKPEVGQIEGGQDSVKQELFRLGRWTRGQKNVLAAFLVAVTLWVTPGFLALITGTEAPIYRSYGGRVPEAVAALTAATLLFVLPVNWRKREFTLTWKQATQIDWGTLLLFGGGLTLGSMMFNTGLADAVGRGLLGLSGAGSTWGLTFAAIWVSIIVSEATSNTASATMVVPVIISVAQTAGVNPIPPALGATLAASWGFMLPVSTPPNAIVYGSGMVPITKMIRAGVLFDIGGGILIWLGLRLMLPLLGLA